jgi:hypothetical protein
VTDRAVEEVAKKLGQKMRIDPDGEFVMFGDGRDRAEEAFRLCVSQSEELLRIREGSRRC